MGYITPTAQTLSPVTEEALVDRVKIRMDEIDHSSSSVVDVGVIDNKPVTEMIQLLLNESLLELLSSAPLPLIPKVKKTYTVGSLTNPIEPQDDIEAGAFELPEDMLRLVAVKCPYWVKAVTAMSLPNSQVMARQHFQYARAKKNTPAAVITDGTEVIVFPLHKTIEVVEDEETEVYDSVVLTYISSLTEYDDLGEKMLDAICWNCASKVFSAMGMIDSATKCTENYNSLIK